MEIVELATPMATLRLAPALGGAVVAFTVGGAPILRPTSDAALALGDVTGTSCYPLVPYSNRIRGAELAFAGRRYVLARNFGAHPHAIHGVGWQRAWSVAEASPTHARLVLHHDAVDAAASAWPWPFESTQTFALAERAHRVVLVATLTIVNTGREPFPFGLGFHPFFAADAATRIGFSASGVWLNDPTQLPVAHVAIPPEWRFDPPRPLDAIALDNVFTGWRSAAYLGDAHRSIALDADRALAFLVVYAPHGHFVALEPVTNATDAFNRAASGAPGTGMRVLRPGGSFSCTMRVAAATAGGSPSTGLSR